MAQPPDDAPAESLTLSRSRSGDPNRRLEPDLLRAADKDDTNELRKVVNDARARDQLSENFLRIGLMRSCERGAVEATQYLLSQGAKPNGADRNRLSPLLRAVERNHIAIVKLLLAHDADLDTKDKKGRTALMTAAWKNHWHVLDMLIRKGADVNAKDNRGRNVLHNLAADKLENWGDEVIQLLLDQDIHIDGALGQDSLKRSPLHWACATGKLKLAEQFLTRRRYPMAQVDAVEDRGKTSLHIAAAHDRNDIVELLLRHEAKVMVKSDGGWTPLHNACEKGCADIVHILVKAGAEINAKLLNGMSPLHLAAQGGHLEVVKSLLKHQTTKRAIRDNFGFSPFLRAAQNKHKEIVNLLAPFNQTDILSHDALGACQGFSATIVDFGDFRNLNRVQKQSIFELLYSRDPVNVRKPARTILPADKATRFRWIHLPANNMAWVEALLTKMFIEQGASDVDGFKALERSFSHQHRGQKSHSHFMRPLCQSTPRAQPVPETVVRESAPDQGPPASGINGKSESKHQGSPRPPIYKQPSSVEPKANASKPSQAGGKENTKTAQKEKGKKNTPNGIKSPRIGAETPTKQKGSKAKYPFEAHKPPSSISSREGDHKQKINGSNIFTFMPYLHFETNTKRQEMQEAIKRAEEIVSHIPRPRLEKTGTYDEMLIRAHLATSTLSLHVRRTLDQSFYHNIDTYNRDVDQVVYRYQLKEQEGDPNCDPKVVMVDQLWMWILGKDLIVTAFPQRWQQPKNDPLNVLDSIIEDVNSKTHDRVRSVYDLATIITDRCSGAFSRHRLGDDDYQFLDMFESSIGNVTESETTLFQDFNTASKQASAWLRNHRRPSRFSRYLEPDEESDEEDDVYEDRISREKSRRSPRFIDRLLNIRKETALLAETKDIRDELNMITKVLKDQLGVLPDLQVAVSNIYRDEQLSQRDIKRRFEEQIKGINTHIKDIDRMDKQAERIYKSITVMLDLKQKHANAFEARFARDQAEDTGRQSQTVMVFTIVTIVFLPLSFIAAFFTINIREFPKGPDGGDSMPLSYVCKYMFGIGFAISIPLVIVALLLDDISTFLQIVQGKYKSIMDAPRKKDYSSSLGSGVNLVKLDLEQVFTTTRERRSRETNRPGTAESFQRPPMERAPTGFRMMNQDIERGLN